MYAAPPVAVRCTAVWFWQALQTALPALAAGVFVFWILALAAPDLAPALRAVATLAAGLGTAVLGWRASASAPRWLDWDGQRWSLDGRPGELQLMVDLGRAVLLRHRAGRAGLVDSPAQGRSDSLAGGRHGSPSWLVTTRGQAGSAWHGLRVAVRSPASKAQHRGGPDA